jgi:hypothetical protein
MSDRVSGSFVYEHCDVPAGVPLNEWRRSRPQRRARVAGGVIAALATIAPAVLSVRASRHH